jgi:hypothetical protein
MTNCCCRQPLMSAKATTLILLNKLTGEVIWRRDRIIPNEAESHGVAVVGDEVIANYNYSLGNPDGGNNNRYQVWNTANSPFINLTTNKIAPSAGAATNLGRTSWARKNSDGTFYWLANSPSVSYPLCRTTPGGDYATTGVLASSLSPLPTDCTITPYGGNERIVWTDGSATKYRDLIPGATPSWAAAATSFGTGRMRGDGTHFFEVVSGPTLKGYDGTGTLVYDIALPNVVQTGNTYVFQTGRPAAASSAGVLCRMVCASPSDETYVFVDPSTGLPVNGFNVDIVNRAQADGAIVFTTQQDASDSNLWKVRATDSTAGTTTWLAYTIGGSAGAGETAASEYCVLENGVAYVRRDSPSRITAVRYDGTVLWTRTDIGSAAISVGTAGVFAAAGAVTI